MMISYVLISFVMKTAKRIIHSSKVYLFIEQLLYSGMLLCAEDTTVSKNAESFLCRAQASRNVCFKDQILINVIKK